MRDDYTWNELILDIGDWQADTFGSTSSPRGPVKHLLKEAIELDRHLESHDTVDAEELADILFMLVQTANWADVDLFSVTANKLHKNRQRQWSAPDADGVVEHVRGVHD